jgi:hypothetical protein
MYTVDGDMMEDPLDLERIESSAFRAYFKDGMWDTFFGIMFIVGGLRTIFDDPRLTVLIIIAVIVPVLGKHFITYPRLGHVSFGERRVRGQLYMLVIIVVAVAVSAIIVYLNQITDAFEGRLLGDMVFGAMVIVVTGVLGSFLEYPRLIVHGIIFATIMLISGHYGNDTGAIAYLIGGSVSLVIGLVTLSLFLGKYPPLPMEG